MRVLLAVTAAADPDWAVVLFFALGLGTLCAISLAAWIVVGWLTRHEDATWRGDRGTKP